MATAKKKPVRRRCAFSGCGKLFTTVRTTGPKAGKFCSSACRQAAFRERRNRDRS